MNVPYRSIKRMLLGRASANNGRYLAVIAVLSLVLFGISYWYLYEGWWSGGGPTIVLLIATVFIAVIAGYEQYGLLSGIIGTSLPVFALLLRGEYVATTMEFPSPPQPTPAEYLIQSVMFAVIPGTLIGILGYALGYGLRAVKERVSSTLSVV